MWIFFAKNEVEVRVSKLAAGCCEALHGSLAAGRRAVPGHLGAFAERAGGFPGRSLRRGGEPDLRREVKSLIAADEGSDGFMKRPVHAGAAALGEERSASLAGQHFGPYKLFREPAHGGMGELPTGCHPPRHAGG